MQILKDAIRLAHARTVAMSMLLAATVTEAKLYDKAEAYYQGGELTSAVIELKNLLQENSEDGEARLLLARVYLDQGNAAAAEKELQRALDLQPDNQSAQLLLAAAQLSLGKRDAISELIDPEKFATPASKLEAFALIGQAHLAKQQLVDAKAAFKNALELAKNDRAALGLARIAYVEGQIDDSLKRLGDILTRSPKHVEALLTQGQIHAANNDLAASVESFSSILKFRPKHVVSLLARAEAYLRQGELDYAQKDAEMAFKLYPEIPQANFVFARIYLQAGDYEAAKVASEKVLRVAPEHQMSFFILGSSHYAQGNFEQARFYLEKFVSAQPGHLVASRILGATYLSLKAVEETIELLEPLDQNFDLTDAQILNILGRAYLQKGDYEKGGETLNRALVIDPELSGARTQIALAELAGGDIDGAIGQLQDGAQLNQNSEISTVMLVLSYLKKQDFLQARATAQQAVDQDPTSGVYHNLLGAVFEAQGKGEEALSAYQKAMEVQPTYIPAILSVAKHYLANKELDRAESYYRRALKVDSKHLQAQIALAQIAFAKGETQAYIRGLEAAKASNPESITPVVYLVDHYTRNNNLDRALGEARTFQTNYPNSDQARSLMARIQIARNELAAAKFQLQSFIKNNPQDIAHRYKLAEILVSEGDVEAALESIDEILEIEPRNPPVLGLKAKALIGEGDYVAAEKVIELIDQEFPESAGDEQLRGDLHLAKQEFEAALEDYKRAYEQAKDPYLVNAITKLLSRNNNLEGRESILSDYLQHNPRDLNNRLRLASVLQQQEKNADAIEQYELIRSQVPDNFMVLNNLAWLYWLGDDDRALELAAQAYELVPDRPEVTDTYGWIMLHMGDKKRALELIQSAASRAPTNPEILYHRAKALSMNGQQDEAVKELRRVLRDHGAFAKSEEAKALLAALE